ncbi:hypothetical protein [Stackebrandtia soli]|uniref:hypothetical protein n=1 Tax=Stackebrandtia soli TaxID=1892856 RepID=UPI0039EC9710
MTDENRWGDMAPVPSGSAPGYDRTTTKPVRRIALYKRGILMGHVWSDGENAAGFDAAEPTEENARETGRAISYVWRVHALAHQRGEPASVVLEARFYEPLYEVRPA